MTRPTIKIHDCATDEVVVRELNDAELAQYEADVAAAEAKVAAKAEAQANKAALLTKLGITADEAKLLLS
jgi:hypothetical protein